MCAVITVTFMTCDYHGDVCDMLSAGHRLDTTSIDIVANVFDVLSCGVVVVFVVITR